MKKVFLLTLALLTVLGGAQAQNNKSLPSPNQKSALTIVDQSKKPAPKNDKVKNNMQKKHNFLKIVELDPNAREIGLESSLYKAFQLRSTERSLSGDELPRELLSSLLWSAYGINRPDEGKRVVPSACNSQEFDIYLFDSEGIWLYDAEKCALGMVEKGDHRAEISKQEHFAKAPVSLVLVADYSRMERIKETSDREFYAAVDAGYISQNIYLFCASANLGTVACGAIDREHLNKLLNITDGKAILAHPVGMRK